MAVQPVQSRWELVKRHRHFYLFIAPFFFLFGVFGLFPLIFSLCLSFVKWDGMSEMRWVGMSHFVTMSTDEILHVALQNTLILGLLSIPAMLILAFAFAVLLNSAWLKSRGLFRSIFFLPCITPMVAAATVFVLVFSTERGLLNYLIVTISEWATGQPGKPIGWLVDESWSKPSIAIMSVWRWTGYTMVLMLAGLQGIPRELYEAARLDGAGTLRQVKSITLPLMRPVFAFCTITAMLGAVYMFDEILVLTKGGPGTSSLNLGLFLFSTSFVDFRFGYASAVGYSVAAVVFLASLAFLRFVQRGEE